MGRRVGLALRSAGASASRTSLFALPPVPSTRVLAATTPALTLRSFPPHRPFRLKLLLLPRRPLSVQPLRCRGPTSAPDRSSPILSPLIPFQLLRCFAKDGAFYLCPGRARPPVFKLFGRRRCLSRERDLGPARYEEHSGDPCPRDQPRWTPYRRRWSLDAPPSNCQGFWSRFDPIKS